MTEAELKSTGAKAPQFTAHEAGTGWLADTTRRQIWAWVMWGSVGDCLLVAGGSLLLYLQQQLWQNLALAGAAMGAVGLLLWGWRRKTATPFGFIFGLLGALLLLYGGATVLFEGVTGYVWLGLGLMLFSVHILLDARRQELWLGGMGLGVVLGVLEMLIPFPRIAAPSQWPLPGGALLGSSAVYLVTLIWALAYWVNRLSIRVRMVAASFVSVLFTVLAVTAVSVWLGWRGVQRHVLDRLELAAELRESQITLWGDALQTDLNAVVADSDVASYAGLILRQHAGVTATAPMTIPTGMAATLETYLETARRRTQSFQDLTILNVHGQVIASTDGRQRGRDYAAEPFFIHGREGFTLHWALGASPVVRVSRPILDEETHTASGAPLPPIGVLVGETSLNALNGIMGSRVGVGETGATYLVGPDRLTLTSSRAGAPGQVVKTPGVTDGLTWRRSGYSFYVNELGTPLVEVYRWVPEIAVLMIVQQERSEAFQELYTTILLNGGIAFLSLVLTVGIALIITRSIVNPLRSLTHTAAEIAGGDLTRRAQIERLDEIGRLGLTFNSMAEQLQGAFSGLEQGVAQRTYDLQRRSRYLEAAAEVGRAVSSILNTEQLIREVVDLILERFDLYYVGLFLTEGELAILRAGTGAAGAAMLARGHRLRVGEGMIGWSIAHNQARIASKAQTDAVRLTNPELPDTRSEAALPLRSRSQVLGALSVQSAAPDAFDEDTISVLQTMADLVAVSLDNTRLFTDAQEALEAERRAYGQHTRETWLSLMQTYKTWNYAYVREAGQTEPLVVTASQGNWDGELLQVYQTNTRLATVADTAATLTLPLRASGQVVGALHFERTGLDVVWTDEELMLLETLTDQLGQTLERAQLYLETQQRATRDRLVADLSARMRESLEIDTVLRTTVREIFDALNFASVEVRLSAGADAGAAEGEPT